MKMEQNNIENQFREKLNKRDIKPSENSWDRLDAMLTVSEKPKRNFRWMYFAASFLGFILIATVFLSQTEEAIDSEHQPVVFEQKTIQNQENVLENNSNTPIETPSEVVATAEAVVTKYKSNDKSASKTTQKSTTKYPTETAIVATQNSNKASIITQEQSSNWRSNQKTEIQVDANALLSSVDQNKSNQAVAKNTVAIKVNTKDLLSKVDSELELSFRERVLQSVNKKYKEVKVAVTNRNLQ
jgi:hypothetical protein